MISSILDLNTSPSFSSKVSPRAPPARAALGADAAALAVESAGGAGGVVRSLAGLSRRTEALERPLLLLGGGSWRTLRVRGAGEEELDSDFACDFPLLPDELELDFSSSRFARVPPEGLTGSASSSLARSRFQRLLFSPELRPDLDS